MKVKVVTEYTVDVWHAAADRDEGTNAGWMAAVRMPGADIYIGPYATKTKLRAAVNAVLTRKAASV